MKFGAKLLDSQNINLFTQIVSTISKLCSKTSNDKSCVLKLTSNTLYFILPEFAANNVGHNSSGRTSFWTSIDPKTLFEFYVCEGKVVDKNNDDNENENDNEQIILLEIQPESLLRALKSTTSNIKMIRIKLTKRQLPCITVEIDLHSMCNRSNSRSITHDIPVKVISTSKISLQDFTEPSVDRATLNIQLPPLKIIKNMIERMKCLSEYVCLEASDKGTLNFKIDSDAVSVCCYFRNLPATAENAQQRQLTTPKPKESVVTLVDSCTVRLSLKRLHDFFNSLQFQPTKIVCYFLNQKYAHFCVIHEEDMVLQYLVSSVLS